MKTLYWLPEIERGCNAIELRRVDWGVHGWAITFQAGSAESGEDGEPDRERFVPDPFLHGGLTVQDTADFEVWLAEQEPQGNAEEHFVSVLMRYLWRQHKGLRPLPTPPTEEEVVA